MLTQAQTLIRDSEGRYLRDGELDRFGQYAAEFQCRVQAYQRLQALEAEVLSEVETKLRYRDPSLMLYGGGQDASLKWRRDTLLTYRAIARTVLLSDIDHFKQGFLLWMETVMRAFGALPCCEQTYGLMASLLERRLSEPEAVFVLPVVYLTQETLADKLA